VNRALLPLKSGEVWVALDASRAREVLGRSPWMRIPGAPPQLPGVLSWRGRAIAVLDLGLLLRAAPLGAAEAGERTVIFEIDGCTLGVFADAVREVALVPEDQLSPAHATAGPFCTAEVELNGTRVAVLDLPSILVAVMAKGA
jgi:purine-binding chemotaxis protein CheW